MCIDMIILIRPSCEWDRKGPPIEGPQNPGTVLFERSTRPVQVVHLSRGHGPTLTTKEKSPVTIDKVGWVGRESTNCNGQVDWGKMIIIVFMFTGTCAQNDFFGIFRTIIATFR